MVSAGATCEIKKADELLSNQSEFSGWFLMILNK